MTERLTDVTRRIAQAEFMTEVELRRIVRLRAAGRDTSTAEDTFNRMGAQLRDLRARREALERAPAAASEQS